MSRDYRFEAAVTKMNSAQARNAEVFFERWGAGPVDCVWKEERLEASGKITLSGGESEEEAHQRLRELFPSHAVSTKWWVDEHLPDEMFDDFPLRTGFVP